MGGAGYEASGDPLPPKTLALAKAADAVLFGAVGDPRYDTLPRAKRPEQAILGLRKELGLFANLRPAQVHPERVVVEREPVRDPLRVGRPRGRRRKPGTAGRVPHPPRECRQQHSGENREYGLTTKGPMSVRACRVEAWKR